MGRSTSTIARKALDADTPAHHVLGHAGPRAAFDGDIGMHIHTRRVVTGVAMHHYFDRCVKPGGEAVRTVGVMDLNGSARCLTRIAVQVLIEFSHRLLAQIKI